MCDCSVVFSKFRLAAMLDQELGESEEMLHVFHGVGSYVPGDVFLKLETYRNSGAMWWTHWTLTPDGRVAVACDDHYACCCLL